MRNSKRNGGKTILMKSEHQKCKTRDVEETQDWVRLKKALRH